MRASLLTLAVMLAPNLAHAFVCSRVTTSAGDGASLSWSMRDLDYTYFTDGTADLESDEEFDVVDAAFTTWEGVEGCARPDEVDLSFTRLPGLSTTDRVGYDFVHPENNENLMIFRDDAWPMPGQQRLIIALTTTTYAPLTGEIFDADIEFNSAGFEFVRDAVTAPQNCTVQPVDCDCATHPANCRIVTDLRNTAVHEIGHYLGLAHSPDTSATMFSESKGPREIEKRDLACDDRNAIVFKYPAGEANGYCDPTPACGQCAPPGVLTRRPDVTVDDEDDGMGGCTAVAPSWAAVATIVVALGSRRRRPCIQRAKS